MQQLTVEQFIAVQDIIRQIYITGGLDNSMSTIKSLEEIDYVGTVLMCKHTLIEPVEHIPIISDYLPYNEISDIEHPQYNMDILYPRVGDSNVSKEEVNVIEEPNTNPNYTDQDERTI
jgi:hypothetical protein